LETELDAAEPCARQQRRFADVKRYILANLHDPDLDLARIVTAQDMAPRTLYRLFAGEGTTPMRWLWQQRLAASFRALAEGQFTQVTDVALSFGFSDVSHFSRAFKAAYGHSPRALMRRKPG
jgi:AraC-like DNA-binding protein